MSFLKSLNAEQRIAVTHRDGPLLVLAGAGSGKTRVIISRVAHLILDQGARPQSILAVTFTNKAADEMRERVLGLLAEQDLADAGLPTVATFHSFCARILRQYGEPLAEVRKGFDTDFTICDADDQLAVIRNQLQDRGIRASELNPKKVRTVIGRLKTGQLRSLADLPRNAYLADELRSVVAGYESELLAGNALDFGDLLLETARLLDHDKGVRDLLRARYQHVLVDEYQDTNRPQYDLLRILVEPRQNLCVVGDEDQVIYSWRGARIENILNFQKDFPTAKIVRLEQNYRSTGTILEAASALIEHNEERIGKNLWTKIPSGEPIILYRAADATAEARFVAKAAAQQIEADSETRVGILYRTNAQSRLFEEAMRREGVEFAVVGALAFYQRAEIKDVVAYLRAVLDPPDGMSLQRIINVPARGIGASTMKRLREHAKLQGVSFWQAIEDAATGQVVSPRARSALRRFRELMAGARREAGKKSIERLAGHVIEETGYGDMLRADGTPESLARLENLQELLVAAGEADQRGETLREFLDQAALAASTDAIQDEARVLLMTIHSAKGLEFPVVALVGLQENILPHAYSMTQSKGQGLEEERRLFYVGMTRARRQLILTHSMQPSNPTAGGDPSRFLAEIPGSLIKDLSPRGGMGRTSFRRPYGWRRRAHRQSAPDNGSSPSRPAPPPVDARNSVDAVASFFRERGVPLEAGPGPRREPSATAPARTASPRSSAAPLPSGRLVAGARVRHQRFGAGTVRRREGSGPAAKLFVYFDRYGLKKLIAGPAKLEVL